MTMQRTPNGVRRCGIVTAFVSTVTLAIAGVPAPAMADRSEWISQFGTTADEIGSAVAVHGRNVYVSGNTLGAFPGETNLGGQDAFVRRYDSHGRLRWTRQFGTTGDDQPRAGVLAAGANLVVVGGSVMGALPGQTWSLGLDSFVRAYDRKGNVLWTRQFGTPQNDFVRGVTIAKDGSVFVSGQTRGPAATDVFVKRLGPDGTERWSREFGTSGADEGTGIEVTADAVYVTGHTTGSFPGFTNLGPAGTRDIFVARLTLDGEIEWITQFGTSAVEFGWGVGVAGPTVFVAGHTLGAFPGEVLLGDFDGFVAALGTDGQLRWARQFGSTACDMMFSLATDHEGAVVVGQVGGTLQVCGGVNADAFARKYDPEGDVIWTMQFGTPSADNVNGVALKGRNIYMAGMTQGDLGGLNAGGRDAFVLRTRDDHTASEDDDEADIDDE